MARISTKGFGGTVRKAKEELPPVESAPKEIPWKLAEGPQTMAAESKANEVYFGGASGGGKAQSCHSIGWAFQNLKYFSVDSYHAIISSVPEDIRAMDSKVLMWNGDWKSFSEVEVGDRIMNPDGQSQEIIQIHERGFQPIYKVSFEDKTRVECDGDHLWGFWEAGANSRRKTSGGRKEILGSSDPVAWNTNYIIRARTRDTKWLHEQVQKGRRFIIPINAEMNYTNLHRGIAERAYLYGALIGDGAMQSRSDCGGMRLFTADEHIKLRCLSMLSEDTSTSLDKTRENPFWVIRVKDKWVYAWARAQGLLGKHSHDKFIPSGHLKESLAFRWNLAQGLFDTDGYASMALKNEVSYCTVSPQLAEDVAALVRSLGFMAKIRKKQGVCYNKGCEGEKRMAYIVTVEGNDRWKLFSLPRKVEAARNHEPHIWVGKQITGIEQIGSTYCRCITVSNPNGLYVTDDFNVTHNSALLLILASTRHRKSIIFRRVYPNLKGMIEKSKEVLRGIGRYNSTDKIWRDIPGDRTLEFGAIEYEDDKEKYRGNDHDGKFFDELTEISQSQFEFVSGWNRTTIPDQQCKIVATFNPPSSRQGAWIVKKLAPWLDKRYAGVPAEPGELRWFIRDRETNEEVEVPNGDVIEYKGETLTPRSRTFIPSSLDNNAFLKDSGYRAMLQSLPEPLRSQLLYGDFTLTDEDDAWQVIPTAWVRAAIARWTEKPVASYDAVGVDVSRGGGDETVIAPRAGFWIDTLRVYAGLDVPDGDVVAGYVISHVTSKRTAINIDIVGVGYSPYDSLKRVLAKGQKINGLNGGESSVTSDGERKTDRTGLLGFVNRRAEWWWNLRELLDPRNGHELALPDDDKMVAALTSFLWSPVPISDPGSPIKSLVRVETKDEAKRRLKGISFDRGDAIVYAFAPVDESENPWKWMSGI